MKFLGIIFMCLCIVTAGYLTVNANQEVKVDYKHDLYRQAKKLEAERDYHGQKEQEHKQIKETKASEAIVKWGQYNELKNGLSASSNEYKSKREEYLYTKVEQTVDLPGFGLYQDLLASYAYNTCLVKLGAGEGPYSCKNLVLTWNSENGGWNYQVYNNRNSNGTHDGGLCQLNSKYHMKFIKSEWMDNPLAQLDYCLGVREDAKKKQVQPWYGYNVRHQRDKGILFLK